MTENHDLKTPTEGTLDWHVPLNENFKKLDAKVEIRDTESNRNNYTPKSGAKYLAIDTGNRYVGDGSSWNELSFRLPRRSSDPSSAVHGQMWYRTDLD